MIFYLVLCLVVVYLLYSWADILAKYRQCNVNGPLPLPIIGNAHLFLVKSAEFLPLLKSLSQKYGEAFLVFFLSTPYVIVSHPKYIEPIISSSELITKGHSYRFLLPWLGQGLLTSTGQRWKTHRKFLTPAFHFNILQNFLPVFCKNERILLAKLKKIEYGEPVDLFPIIALAALDNVTESIMGVSFNAQKNSFSKYVKSIDIMSKIISMKIEMPLIGAESIYRWLPYKQQEAAALSILHEETRKVIQMRRDELEKANITGLGDSNEFGIKNKNAFLDLLLLAEVDGQKFDDEMVQEQVDTFMFEGHDTTTSGIVFTLYCLAKHADVQEKLYQEQRNIFGEEIDRDPTYHELHQMKYLELVIKESLRLYPSVPLIERLMTKDTDIGGLHLLKGSSLTMNIFQAQRHPDIFEDPLEFRPERFNTATSNQNAYHWIAFSAGPRNCIGQKFAMMELKVTVSGIIRHFKLSPTGMEPELSADLVLRSKNGVQVFMKPRM